MLASQGEFRKQHWQSFESRLALCREPSHAEMAEIRAFLQDEPLEQVCRVILNLNEFVYPE